VNATISDSLLQRAIETDRIYFELGATLAQLSGATLAWMPGLAHTPAGAVIQRVDKGTLTRLGTAWIEQAEKTLRRTGARLARIYLDDRDEKTDALFRAAGYKDREELVFTHRLAPPSTGLALRPAESDEDWQRKLALHAAEPTPPDGHSTPGAEWVELERRKCRHGMSAYLAELDGEAVGTVCMLAGKGVLRIKNLLVHPAYRRQTIGHDMLSLIAAVGRERGISEQCVFAVRGDAGEAFYRAAGMKEVGSVVEWSKPMGGAAG